MEPVSDPYVQALEAFARSAAELIAPDDLEAVFRAAQANMGTLRDTHDWV